MDRVWLWWTNMEVCNIRKWTARRAGLECPDFLLDAGLCSSQVLFHGDHTAFDTVTGGGTNDGAAQISVLLYLMVGRFGPAPFISRFTTSGWNARGWAARG